MSKSPGPFRADAIASRSANQIGAALLSRPKTFSLMVTIAGLAVATLILMLVFLEYTSRTTVGGIILPSAGLVKIYTHQAGTLSEIKVEDGSFVRKGQPLFTISNDKHANAKESTQASLSNLNKKKLRILAEQRERAVEIASSQKKALKETEAQLTAAITNLKKQVLLKRQRLSLTQQNASRYESLTQQGFISNEMLADKMRDGLEQQELLTALERDEIEKQSLLRNNRSEQNLNTFRLDNQLLQFDREIADLQQESLENSNRYELTINAPDDGRLVGVTARRGDTVTGQRALASLIPLDSPLQAELFANSRAMGFMRPGATVSLRLQAYPYQKFGTVIGTVRDISDAPISTVDLGLGFAPMVNGRRLTDEGLYRVTVKLRSQTIQVADRPEPLRVGLLVDGDVFLETRRLYEWMLEPLLGLKNRGAHIQ